MCCPEKKLEGEMGVEKKRRSSLTLILRYADWLDILLMVLGTFGAVGDGMSTNCLLVYVSRLFNSLGYGNSLHNPTNFMNEIEKVYYILFIIHNILFNF